ncbi:outer membrane beta-barrel family protein [Flavobacterium sp. '19STA2R22 D10 B1']|uniref:outer membrane beta-barrel family protein n=1 Tax=Flavobacterium aerium TaxID=3037261 RepID=UPI00278C6B68|nr:outer membrane beta-barrel family protein [Flavobacterium sp. '19STA2R22 D10 B1']
MKNLKFAITLVLLSLSFLSFSQQRPAGKKVKITGKAIEKETNLPLEYATIIIENSTTSKVIGGGITDDKGEFNVDVEAGTYNIKVEFISFKTLEIKARKIEENTNLGILKLDSDSQQLDEVKVVLEKSTVEIKLDKKVYNVGSDMMVKGGTVSDVLDNVPSVSVDVEGNVSLRGNENVRILIDGKPSGLAGINIAEALRILPADAVEKVEVITNPSARYDAEGGGGIINIILKKGKAQGLNGTFTATTGNPDNHGISGNLNFRSENFNLFTTSGYNYRKGPGNAMTNSEFLDNNGNVTGYTDERRNNERLNRSYNTNFGMEWFVAKSTTWTNSFSYRKSNGENPDNVNYFNYDANRNFLSTRNRFNDQRSESENVEFASNITHKFKKDGHKLTIDASFSKNKDEDDANITDIINEKNLSNQEQNRTLVQTDYVLPIGESSQFEAGYKGDFSELLTNFQSNPNTNFSYVLDYKEKVNALYTQFGSKINKFSYLLGLRWEDTNINIDLLSENNFNTKKYNNFFPSAFLAYEFSETSSASLSYSRRVTRPRSRFINPFSSNSSNINRFQGNPDLNPSFTDAIDFGYLKKWDKVTFNTSMYFNVTKDAFQFIRRETGELFEGNPITVSTPINLATEYRFGFEFTLSYNPYRWWKLNGNFNFFRNQTDGDYSYIDSQTNQEVVQNFDKTAYSWFTRVSSRINLPYGIDWQTNATYNAPQSNAQGRSKGIASANLALSKDVLKDKATIAFNISDIFNSRKRITETNLATVNSYSEMQWRERQITLSFTYRFNKKKTEREKQPKKESDGGSDEYMG